MGATFRKDSNAPSLASSPSEKKRNPFRNVNRVDKSTIDWDDIQSVESDDGTVKRLTKAQRVERKKRKDKIEADKELEKNVSKKLKEIHRLQQEEDRKKREAKKQM